MSSTVNNQLEKIQRMKHLGKVCNDFYIGSVRVMNEEYLPVWKGENEQSYLTRLANTSFTNMYAPIVDGLVGLVTAKEPKITGYDEMDMNNVDMKHSSLSMFGKEVIKKSLNEGICFVVAEKNAKANRIYLKTYSYRHLYNYIVKDGVLEQIVFKDTVEVADGEFGLKERERYKVFRVGGGAIYYEADNGGGIKSQVEWKNTLKEVPVVAFKTGKELSQYEIVPKLYDIAKQNQVHLGTSSFIANVLSIAGNPIPVFYGATKEGKVVIGVKDALKFDDKTKEGFEWVEIEGKTIDKLQEKLKRDADDIDKLTFNLLTKQDSKTVIDAENTQRKNSSFLADMATELEVKMNRIMQFVAELENKTLPKDAKIEYKKDFDATIVDLEIAQKLLLAGEMSRETYYTILKTGSLPKEFTIEEENDRIESQTSTGIEE